MELSCLPSEILQQIFLYLSGDELAKFGSTSRINRSLANDDYVWKKICKRDEINEIRKIEISHRAVSGLEILCDWWTTYMESRNYFYFNWKYGRKQVKKFTRAYSDYFIAADETGLAIANENGTISVYDSYMKFLWSVQFEGEIDSLAKWKDSLCIAGENGVTLFQRDKVVCLEIWGEVHFLPKSGMVWVLDDDECNLASWCMSTLELVSWFDYQSHYSDRVISDDLYAYGIGQTWITCFDTRGRIATTLNLDSTTIIRVNGNDEAVAALAKTDRYSITVWSRATSRVLKVIDLNRPYCLKLNPKSNILAYSSRDLEANVFSTFRLDTSEQSSGALDYDSIANMQIYFLAKDVLVLFVRMDWEPYTRMVVCDDRGSVLYTSALRVKYIIYADRRKVVLKYNSELQIIYFDHRD